MSPRLGRNLARLSDILAVFSAAGWKTDTARVARDRAR
jgi:hypothetical protein